jgi:excisionase family DNA binding protein
LRFVERYGAPVSARRLSMTRLLTDAQVAEVLGLKPSTIRQMRADGRLPFVRPTGARAVRVRQEDLEELIRRAARV